MNIILFTLEQDDNFEWIEWKVVTCKCSPIEICDECLLQEEFDDEEEERDYCICGDDENNPNCEWCF